jgi:hypothetical protein
MALLILLTVIMIFLYGQIDFTRPPFAGWDLANYRMMAQAAPQLAEKIPQPFAFRVLGPYLAGLLPFADPLAFQILTVICAFLLIILFYWFLIDRRIPPVAALAAAALFAMNRALFGISTWDFFQINDLLVLIFLLLLLLAMYRGRWLLFGLVFFLGAATRETTLILVPVVFVYLWETRRLRAEGLSALLATVPGLLLFVLLRLLIPAWGPGLAEALRDNLAKLISPESWFRLLIGAFLPVSLVPIIFFDTTIGFFRERKYALVFVVLVFLATLFGSNTERLMAPAFVVYYWLIAVILASLTEQPPLFWLVLAASFVASLHHTVARFPLPSRTFTLIASFGALAAVSAALIGYRLYAHLSVKRIHSPVKGKTS